jgi:phosphoglycolate phosphatase-like HAD superfamily hydrolase
MKTIIAFDLDGTIIGSEASLRAHATWFDVMAMLLGDESVKKFAGSPDYFAHVLDIMERLTGLSQWDGFDKETMVRYSRTFYQMIFLAEIRKEGQNAFVPDIIDAIIDLKQKSRIALITTSPEDVVLPVLEIGKIKGLFDYIYRTPISKEPSKLELMKKFVNDVGKPALYIGNDLKDAEACKELGITFALAKWSRHDKYAENLAKFNLDSPKQLKGILDVI